MSAEGEPLAADAEPDLEHGPCMMALTEKQRAFVLAMARNPMGTHTDWAKEAGYAKRGLRVRAFETYHDPAVQDAVLEVAKATLGARGPLLAVHGLLQIAADAKHPGRLKALELIANRVGFSEKQQIEITHRDLTGDALLERIQYLSNMPLSSEVKLPDTNAFTHPAIIEHRAAEPSDNLDPSLDPNSAAADRRQNRLGGTISESAETAHISRTDRPDKKSLPDLENRRNQAGVRRSVGEPVVGQEIERRRMRRRGARVRLLPVIVVEEAADRQPTPADESCAKQANRAAARNQDSPIIRAHSASLSNRAKVRDKPRDKPVRQHRFLDRRRGESEERRPSTHRDNR